MIVFKRIFKKKQKSIIHSSTIYENEEGEADDVKFKWECNSIDLMQRVTGVLTPSSKVHF